MWSSREEVRDRKAAAAQAVYYQKNKGKKDNGRFSSAMAMVLGFIVTVEIMIAGAMVLNIDFHTADVLTICFSFAVLYFTVVAVLTDK